MKMSLKTLLAGSALVLSGVAGAAHEANNEINLLSPFGDAGKVIINYNPHTGNFNAMATVRNAGLEPGGMYVVEVNQFNANRETFDNLVVCSFIANKAGNGSCSVQNLVSKGFSTAYVYDTEDEEQEVRAAKATGSIPDDGTRRGGNRDR